MIVSTMANAARVLPSRISRVVSRRISLALLLGALCSATGSLHAQTATSIIREPTAVGLPEKLSDAEFWRIMSEFSEATGVFPSENFTSNETGFQVIIPRLQQRVKPGGVYLGVGPEQNFTYIVALQPKYAFITDIRRQNLLTHLIYKSMMERSENRADFLSKLFSRQRPIGLDSNSSPAALFDAYLAAPGDTAVYHRNITEVTNHLTKTHGFALSSEDIIGINHVIEAFYLAGPLINYNYTVERGLNGGGRGVNYANYSTLMRATDATGLNRAFLANETNYRQIRAMQLRNAIVPIVGDFGGTKALPALADYLTKYNATVTTYYCSNVEQYLFNAGTRNVVNGGFSNFYSNVGKMPLDSTSTFIRSGAGSNFGGGGFGGGGGGMGNSVIASMQATVAAFKAGQLTTWQSIFGLSLP